MCGITGWVDFEREFSKADDLETVKAMTATMSCRGPDDEGWWTGTHVALGHRRLAVIDIEGGRQPMLAERDSRVLAVLTYSGEVYNYRDLRRELESRGHRFRTMSDTEVVLTAYLEWGQALTEHLNGMYAFAVWDVRSEKLLLVRDRMGIKPLYYYPTPHGVLFGSEPKAILANPLATARVDDDGLREALASVKTPGAAIFGGMYELRPGHVVRLDRSALREHRYWRLEARPHEDDTETTVAKVRELLDDIVTRQLVSDVPLCTLLSGGLDSSVITALAARQSSTPVRSFAVDFAGYSDNFRPDVVRDTPDAPYVAELATHAGTDHRDIVLDTRGLMDRSNRTAVAVARDLPASMGDLDTSLYLLFKAIREHSTVALSGESADEIFGGYAWFHDRAIVEMETFPWLGLAVRASGGNPAGMFAGFQAILSKELVDRLDLGTFVVDSYRQAIADVPVLEGETGLQRRMREISHLHLDRFLPILLDRKDRMSMAVGLEVRVPFCDHRLVEYVFNAPWALKTYDGREKSLLRGATADLLPASILERRKVPYPQTQDPEYDKAIRTELVELLESDDPLRPHLNVEGIRAILGAELDPTTSMMVRMTGELMLSLNTWLRRFGITL